APVSAPTKDGSAAIAAEVPLQPAVVPAPISTGRSQGEKSSTPDTSRIKTAVAGSNGSGGSGSLSASIRHEQAAFAHEEGSEIPVAIVSLGCVFPGAHDPEQYWSNILNGVSGITNLADVDPAAARDFLAGNEGPQIRIIPDKTYTLLHGGIGNISYDRALLSAA